MGWKVKRIRAPNYDIMVLGLMSKPTYPETFTLPRKIRGSSEGISHESNIWVLSFARSTQFYSYQSFHHRECNIRECSCTLLIIIGFTAATMLSKE